MSISIKISTNFICALFCLFVFNQGLKAQEVSKPKSTIAVLDFIASAGISPNAAPTITNVFRSALIETDKYAVLERSDMQSILEEQAFALSGVCNSAECAVEIGQLLSAEKIILGDIGKIGQAYSINLRLVDVSTGKIDKSLDERFEGSAEDLIDLFKVMAQKFAGIYKEPTSIWWYIGGAAAIGTGIAAAIILSQTDESEETYNIGRPPPNPTVP
jgi:hypothetical protein